MEEWRQVIEDGLEMGVREREVVRMFLTSAGPNSCTAGDGNT